jgi:hypothetical protein
MGKYDKILKRILNGNADANIRFEDLSTLLIKLGFSLRTKGSHSIFTQSGIEERLNLQKDGANAKKYQIRQVRNILISYNIGEL